MPLLADALRCERDETEAARHPSKLIRKRRRNSEVGLHEETGRSARVGARLRGYRPFLSIEITKECPLHCPGCYAYSPDHLGQITTLRQLSDYRGEDLVNATLAVVRRLRPVHLSIIGGEPLVRYRELDRLLPRLDRMGVEVQLVTSAVRPIPREWSSLASLHLVVSVDGLAPEHDLRRAPATYDRILTHISGHRVAVHCTVTRQMVTRSGYLCRVRAVLVAAAGDSQNLVQHLHSAGRRRFGGAPEAAGSRGLVGRVIRRLETFESTFAAAGAGRLPEPAALSRGVLRLRASPTCLSADLKTHVSPCQLGGKPVCAECGCMASAGMHAVSGLKLAGLLPLSAILDASMRVGGRNGRLAESPGTITIAPRTLESLRR